MLRHLGSSRNHLHNVKLAALLSFVAGCVNVIGFLSVKVLTTNVTGHFAFFMEEFQSLRFWNGFQFMAYVLAFFLGAFTTGFLIELVRTKPDRLVFLLPISLEILVLCGVGSYAFFVASYAHYTIALLLLFAMGVQNALVTRVSNEVVRTTHLTGLFTDLGIEIAQLFFYKQHSQQYDIFKKIKLLATIVISFFMGGILGGILNRYFGLQGLFAPAVILLIGLFYDISRIKIKKIMK